MEPSRRLAGLHSGVLRGLCSELQREHAGPASRAADASLESSRDRLLAAMQSADRSRTPETLGQTLVDVRGTDDKLAAVATKMDGLIDAERVTNADIEAVEQNYIERRLAVLHNS